MACEPRSRLIAVLALGAVLLGVGSSAAAAPGDADARARLEAAEDHIDEVARAARLLEMEVAPGRARLNESMAMQRYQDAVYHYLIGEYTEAAESFFALVTTSALADAGLQWDAEWYLAESLLEMGNPEIAEPTYATISKDDAHPFREDAVRRLLEIYSRDEDATRFDRLYQQEILRGDVAPSDLILYAVGKAFYIKGDLAKAKSYMMELSTESAFYGRARYFLGAMLVAQGDAASLAEAMPYFQELVQRPAETSADQQVHDLSLLALARIHYELSDFAKAVEYYGLVGEGSGFLDEKLHELVWSHVKQGEYKQALDAVDVFLLAFPQHRYAADLQLVRGHLLYREELYDDALGAYKKVVDEFTPVRERFASMAAATDDAGAYFQEVLSLDTDDLYAPREEGQLPAYAISVMLSDHDFNRSITLYRDIQRQEEAVAASEALVAELEQSLGGKAGAIDLASLRHRVGAARTRGLDARIELLEAEAAWLIEAGGAQDMVRGLQQRLAALASDTRAAAGAFEQAAGDAERARIDLDAAAAALKDAQKRLDELRARLLGDTSALQPQDIVELTRGIVELETEVAAQQRRRDAAKQAVAAAEARGADLHELELRASTLWQFFQSARTPAGIAVDVDPTGARVDALHVTIDQALSRLGRVEGMLGAEEDTELFRIRATFAQEAKEVVAQRAELSQTSSAASAVAATLVQDNFRRLEAQFAESVLGAEKGIVNVYWSQWVAVGEERTRLTSQRNAIVVELERRFALLQQKLNQ